MRIRPKRPLLQPIVNHPTFRCLRRSSDEAANFRKAPPNARYAGKTLTILHDYDTQERTSDNNVWINYGCAREDGIAYVKAPWMLRRMAAVDTTVIKLCLLESRSSLSILTPPKTGRQTSFHRRLATAPATSASTASTSAKYLTISTLSRRWKCGYTSDAADSANNFDVTSDNQALPQRSPPCGINAPRKNHLFPPIAPHFRQL